VTDLFKRSVPKTNFAEVHKLIHGQVKCGKTTLVAQMKVGDKEPLFIATEDGHHSLGVFHQPVNNWADLKATITKLNSNLDKVKASYSTLAIDLLSDLDQWCEDWACNELKVKSLADLDFGKGFTFKKKEFNSTMVKLLSILPCTFISHSKEKEIEVEGGKKIDIYSPNLSNGALEYINGKVDMIGYIASDVKSGKTFITFRPTKIAIAGTRFPHMATEFELDPKDMAKSYAAINTAFINKQ
jgi:hypothetical protein